MTTHAAFEIEPGFDAMLAAVRSDPAGPLMSRRKNVHLAMTVVTELALLVTNPAPQVGEVRVLTVTRYVIAGMGIKYPVAVMARLAFNNVGTSVTLIAGLLFLRGSRRAVALKPVDQMILRPSRFFRGMTTRAFDGGSSLFVAGKALRHSRQVPDPVRRQRLVQVLVT